MSNSCYNINKGINTPIEFKGLKAQYIWWIGAGVLIIMIVFAVMYIAGVNVFVCLLICLLLGGGWCGYVFRLSAKYGVYGMMKKLAARKVPGVIRCRSRAIFLNRTLHSNIKINT